MTSADANGAGTNGMTSANANGIVTNKMTSANVNGAVTNGVTSANASGIVTNKMTSANANGAVTNGVTSANANGIVTNKITSANANGIVTNKMTSANANGAVTNGVTSANANGAVTNGVTSANANGAGTNRMTSANTNGAVIKRMSSVSTNGTVMNRMTSVSANGAHPAAGVFVVALTELEQGHAKDIRKRPPLPDVKDKGYAWVIVFVMFLSNMVTAGYMRSFGITYNALKVVYPQTSGAMGGAIIALLSGFRSVLAPVVGAAAVHFGCRPVMMCGVTLCASALFVSFFLSSIGMLAITLGAMMGIGMCAIETCQVVVLSQYFSKKKEIANSLRVSGNPLGGAALPFVLLMIFEHYGLQLSFIIMSCVLVQLGAFIFLIRPYKVHQQIVLAKQRHSRSEAPKPDENSHQVLAPQEKAKKFDFHLFLNPLYWSHLVVMMGLSACIPYCQIFVAVYGKSIGFSGTEISTLLAYQAVLDSVSRLTIGFLLNKQVFKKTHCAAVCLLIGGMGTILIPIVHNFWMVLAFFTLFSLGSSGFYANIVVILLDQFGAANASSSWGFMRMGQGILNFVYPPILGYMVDATGSYYLTFFTMGCGMAFGGLSIALQPLVARMAKMEVTFL